MSTKTTFTHESFYKGQPQSVTQKVTDAVTLPQLLQEFELFLKGAGFVFDGTIKIVGESEAGPNSVTEAVNSTFESGVAK